MAELEQAHQDEGKACLYPHNVGKKRFDYSILILHLRIGPALVGSVTHQGHPLVPETLSGTLLEAQTHSNTGTVQGCDSIVP